MTGFVCVRGPIDDCRRGEDPNEVFMGERAFGGGR